MDKYNIDQTNGKGSPVAEKEAAPIECQDIIKAQQEQIQEEIHRLRNTLEPFLDQRDEVAKENDQSMEYPGPLQGHSRLSDGFKSIYRTNDKILDNLSYLKRKVEV